MAGSSFICSNELNVDEFALRKFPSFPSARLQLSLSSSDTPDTAVSGVESSSMERAADCINDAAGDPYCLSRMLLFNRTPFPLGAVEDDRVEPGSSMPFGSMDWGKVGLC